MTSLIDNDRARTRGEAPMEKSTEPAPRSYFAVMKLHRFDRLLLTNGIRLATGDDGPHGFIPVFDTRDQAVKFCNGDETHIAEMRV